MRPRNKPLWAQRPGPYPIAFAAGLFLLIAALGPGMAAEDDTYKVSQGLGVYLGIIPAELVRGPEASAHGGVPAGAHQYHLMVAIFEAASGKRVEDAAVSASVQGLGHLAARDLDLQPMQIAGTVDLRQFRQSPGERPLSD